MHVAIVRIPADRMSHKKLADVARHLQLRRGRGEGVSGGVIEAHPLRKLSTLRYTFPERPQTGEGGSIHTAAENPEAIPIESCE